MSVHHTGTYERSPKPADKYGRIKGISNYVVENVFHIKNFLMSENSHGTLVCSLKRDCILLGVV